ncbi:MAG: hypothetical protein OEZ13_00020 [Spirochaetia bacterium]|nr:hypothetical protein [Spirochaetia bacterium]
MKIFQNENRPSEEEKYFSTENCQDAGMLNFADSAGEKNNLILSYCEKEKNWFLFQTKNTSAKINLKSSFEAYQGLDNFLQFYSLPAGGIGIIQKKKPASPKIILAYPENKFFEIDRFIQNDTDLFFSLKGAWYLIGTPSDTDESNIIPASFYRIKQMPFNEPFNKVKIRNLWYSFIEDFEYVENFDILYLRFNVEGEYKSGIYNIKEKKWELSPPFVLTEEEWNKIYGEKVNIILRLASPEVPEKPRRQYYSISIDERDSQRSKFHLEGQECTLTYSLAEGRHLISFTRFIAEDSEEKSYLRAKNIEQLPPFSIDIEKKRVYLIVLRKGGSDEKKPIYTKVYVLKE